MALTVHLVDNMERGLSPSLIGSKFTEQSRFVTRVDLTLGVWQNWNLNNIGCVFCAQN